MTKWSLPVLSEGLHKRIHEDLATARRTMGHPGTKGDASEAVWLSLLTKYLPRRYRATKAFVVDSKGKFSQQMDVVIYDRQYSPFFFTFKKQKVVPVCGIRGEAVDQQGADRIREQEDRQRPQAPPHQRSDSHSERNRPSKEA